MKPLPNIRSITYLKTKSALLVKQVADKRSPVVITQNGEAMVVVQDVPSYERDRKALLMFKILAQGIQDSDENRLIEQEQVFKTLNAKYK